jgi:hypothetical protein
MTQLLFIVLWHNCCLLCNDTIAVYCTKTQLLFIVQRHNCCLLYNDTIAVYCTMTQLMFIVQWHNCCLLYYDTNNTIAVYCTMTQTTQLQFIVLWHKQHNCSLLYYDTNNTIAVYCTITQTTQLLFIVLWHKQHNCSLLYYDTNNTIAVYYAMTQTTVCSVSKQAVCTVNRCLKGLSWSLAVVVWMVWCIYLCTFIYFYIWNESKSNKHSCFKSRSAVTYFFRTTVIVIALHRIVSWFIHTCVTSPYLARPEAWLPGRPAANRWIRE